ncbi:hypothetical protein [Flammeovirga sp. SJP92]|uniref:hypothetical protein n=1 Tax=Flammeovirga sp. SJP92 TaxID=1775430 RepID=UPI0007889766|nr:hypothetical protein [Flammeovirga sp. SJP92]KXX70142.1 hypothetical protein AVL50_14825 [Flammeovirga sp. SJP92]
MKLISWIKNIIRPQTSIHYWENPISTENIEERFHELYHAYCSLHGTIDLPKVQQKITTIEGNYAVDGHNTWAKDSIYSGNLNLSPTKDGKWFSKWDLGISSQIQSGNGFLHHNFLNIHFSYKDQDNQYSGEVIYCFVDESTAIGFWIEEGIFEVGYEALQLKNKGF